MSWKHQKIYKQASKCDDQKQFKDILDDAMISTLEGFTNGIPIFPMTSTPVKKQSARKSLCLFTNILDVKKKLLPVELELLNLSARQLYMEIHHVHWNKTEKVIKKSWKDKEVSL